MNNLPPKSQTNSCSNKWWHMSSKTVYHGDRCVSSRMPKWFSCLSADWNAAAACGRPSERLSAVTGLNDNLSGPICLMGYSGIKPPVRWVKTKSSSALAHNNTKLLTISCSKKKKIYFRCPWRRWIKPAFHSTTRADWNRRRKGRIPSLQHVAQASNVC